MMPELWAFVLSPGKSDAMPAKFTVDTGNFQREEPLPTPKIPGFDWVGLQPKEESQLHVATPLVTSELFVPSIRIPPFE